MNENENIESLEVEETVEIIDTAEETTEDEGASSTEVAILTGLVVVGALTVGAGVVKGATWLGKKIYGKIKAGQKKDVPVDIVEAAEEIVNPDNGPRAE